MQWIAVSGGWRKSNKKIERDIRRQIAGIMRAGDGIVSGGALGVDSIALDEALKFDRRAERIKIFLPARLNIFAKHFRKRARQGVITRGQAEELIEQLSSLKKLNPKSVIENKTNKYLNKRTYYGRNTKIIRAADKLVAFRIMTKGSRGLGTYDAIQKARKNKLPIKIYNYNLNS
jgi:hypothetical protein